MTDLILPVAGGLLIGLSALAMLALMGRITGISGLFAGAIMRVPGSNFRWAFLIGMIVGPVLYSLISNQSAPAPSEVNAAPTILAGLLVGFGTRFAGGCTSGHGVCGIGRLSPRSIAATFTFIGFGVLTVYITRHLMAA